MPTNIEIKARSREPERQRRAAADIAAGPAEVVDQVDTFFATGDGRLKLREVGPTYGELIFYRREDVAGPKRSAYSVSRTDAPAELKTVLAAALGVRGVVRKRRTIYLVGQTRVHFDEVEGLGAFVELEVVLASGQSGEDGAAVARELMRRLYIDEGDLVDRAYIDLLGDANS